MRLRPRAGLDMIASRLRHAFGFAHSVPRDVSLGALETRLDDVDSV
ncbi:hypothetical protein VH567_14620 [Sphingomonas sp. 4RDLI-65]